MSLLRSQREVSLLSTGTGRSPGKVSHQTAAVDRRVIRVNRLVRVLRVDLSPSCTSQSIETAVLWKTEQRHPFRHRILILTRGQILPREGG
jgi:hypothetical protein